jgi:cytochrome P450
MPFRARHWTPVNVVETLSIPLAIRVAGEFLGVPAEDWQLLRQWADAHRLIIGGGLEEDAPAMGEAIQAERDMYEYFAGGIASRVVNPGGDLMSIVAEMDSDGERLPEDAQVMECVAFLVAGTDATLKSWRGGWRPSPSSPVNGRGSSTTGP